MLSCLKSPLHVSAPSTRTKNSFSAVLNSTDCGHGHSVKSSAVCHPTNDQLHATNKNSFVKRLGLVPAQTSGFNGHSSTNTAVECDVIVIDDDDDDEQVVHPRDSCKADLFGTTRCLRGDLEINGNASSRLLQPNSRLRKLLTIDISSNLGSRVLRNVMSTLKSDGLPLNPYTVSHSLAGSDTALDYGVFCRTPVKGINTARLRCREFPVKYRPSSAVSHYHYYCLTRADRRRFCRRFDTGLSSRSRRLRRKYRRCSVALERLTEEETLDWRSSEHLLNYIMRMQEKDRENAALNASQTSADDEVISLSSDSEDDLPLAVRKHDLMFRCHQCDIKLPCSDGFRHLIREHYRTYHNIENVDIVQVFQPGSGMTMQIVHVPPTELPQSPTISNCSPVIRNCSPIDLCNSETSATPPLQEGISSYSELPNPSQNPVSPLVPDETASTSGMQPSDVDEPPMLAIGISGHPVPIFNYPPMSSQLPNSIRSTAMISGPVPVISLPRRLIRSAPLLNGSAHCRGDAESGPSASVQPAGDADIICLD